MGAGSYDHLVVVAIGRSGTRYAAKLLSGQGIPCTHQNGFTETCSEVPMCLPMRADSSAFAAPFVMEIPDNWKILHQVRDPLKVVDSLIRMRHLPSQDAGLGQTFYKKHAPRATRYKTRIEEALCLWVEWNRMIMRAKDRENYTRHCIESGFDTWKKVVEELGGEWRAEAAHALAKTEGTAGTPKTIKWSNFGPSTLLVEAAAMARGFGYEVDVCM